MQALSLCYICAPFWRYAHMANNQPCFFLLLEYFSDTLVRIWLCRALQARQEIPGLCEHHTVWCYDSRTRLRQGVKQSDRGQRLCHYLAGGETGRSLLGNQITDLSLTL
jgi:hypothetical protein